MVEQSSEESNNDENNSSSHRDDEMSVVSEGGFFELGESEEEGVVLDRLTRLRRENYPTAIDFTTQHNTWTDATAHEAIKTFEHYRDLGKKWHEGNFDCRPTEPYYSVVAALARIDLFRRLVFLTTCENDKMKDPFASSLASVIQAAKSFDSLNIQRFSISKSSMDCLAKAIATNVDPSFGPRDLEFSLTSFGGSRDMSSQESVAASLAVGFRSNTTLQSITFSSTNLSDTSMSILVAALEGHPNLQTFRSAHNEIGKSTMRSLARLLSHPSCKLKELELSAQDGTSCFPLETLLENIPENCSIQSLDLSENSIDSIQASLLLQNIWKCPNLLDLDLSCNEIESLMPPANGLKAAKKANCHLRLLNLDDNPCVFQEPQINMLLKLLETLPELGNLGEELTSMLRYDIYQPKLYHRLDMNRRVRRLMADDSIPAGLWPNILEKCNDDWFLMEDPSRLANVMFHILNGPAFAGRQVHGLMKHNSHA